MTRDEQIATRVNEDEKIAFRVEASKRDIDMADLLRILVYDFLEEEGHDTSRTEVEEGNVNSAGIAATN